MSIRTPERPSETSTTTRTDMNTLDTTGSATGNQLRKVFASFGVRAFKLNPKEITERLGIQPSHSFSRGDKYDTHLSKTIMGVRTRKFGVWQVSSEGVVKSDDLQDHIDYLVDLIRPKQVEIDALLADPDLYLDVRLWIESRDVVNAFTLRSESVAFLASLCREFNVSVIGGDNRYPQEGTPY